MHSYIESISSGTVCLPKGHYINYIYLLILQQWNRRGKSSGRKREVCCMIHLINSLGKDWFLYKCYQRMQYARLPRIQEKAWN